MTRPWLAALLVLAACSGATGTGAGGGTGGGSNMTGVGGGTAGGSGGGTAGGSGGGTAGGSGGTGGGTAGGSGGGSGGSGGGSGVACSWLSDGGTSCPANQYCNAPGCGAGTCTAIPMGAQSVAKTPVCGCDGLDHWNASVAAGRGMAVKATGPCATTVGCGGFAGFTCPSPASCSYEVPSKNDCNISDASGRCWVLPSSCAGGTVTPKTRACGSLSCTDECNLTKLGTLWYADASCP